MSDTILQGQPDEVTVDLLIKQITEGLSPAEQRALGAVDEPVVAAYLRDFERAAAALTLAGVGAAESLPAGLGQRLERQAAEMFGAPRAAAFAPTPLPSRAATAGAAPGRRRSGALGWFAAAACLVLAALGWLRAPQAVLAPPVAEVQVAVPPAIVTAPLPPPPAPPTPAQERDALLARSDTLKVPLGATKDPAAAGVSGDVVWDPATQKGYLRFSGLKPNDPSARQYQAWIFDAGRDQRYPVDAGVFDVPADAAEVIIPIRGAVTVRMVKAFAVTLEKPGGTVVSTRDHVVALGAVG